MVQTVFTNRFGQNSLTNILFMFAQMLCLLISSTAVTEEWSTSFVPFILPMAFISLLLLLQYVIEYFNTKAEADRDLIRQYFYILGIADFVCFNLFALSIWADSGGFWCVINVDFTWYFNQS